MKLKIIQKNWETFTGVLLGIEFVKAVSTEDVSSANAKALAGIVAVAGYEDLEDEEEVGINPSASQVLLDAKDAPVRDPVVAEVQPETTSENAIYTQAELEVIADNSGIDGLREIADPMGIKARSIRELIEAIKTAQPSE